MEQLVREVGRITGQAVPTIEEALARLEGLVYEPRLKTMDWRLDWFWSDLKAT